MFNLSSQELVIILIIALIVVGPQRLPELSRSIGKGIRELRKVQDDVKDMVKFDLEPEKERPTSTRRPASPTSPGVHRTPKPAPSPSSPAGAAPTVPAEAPAVSTSPGDPEAAQASPSDPTPPDA